MKEVINAIVEGFYSVGTFMKGAMIPIAIFFAISNISEYFKSKKKLVSRFNGYLDSLEDAIEDDDEEKLKDEINKGIKEVKENVVDFKNK